MIDPADCSTEPFDSLIEAFRRLETATKAAGGALSALAEELKACKP